MFIKNSQVFDIAIIGNGVLALSTAYYLSKMESKIKICIIGPNHRKASATNAAGAMLSCFSEVTKSTFSNHFAKTKFENTLTSVKLWKAWHQEISSQKRNGKMTSKIQGETILIANSASGSVDDDNFAEIISALKQYKEHYEAINPRHIKGLSPASSSRPLQAIMIPSEGFINPSAWLKDLQDVLQNNPNIIFIDDEVLKIDAQHNEISTIHTINSTAIAASEFLFAAGAFNEKIISQLNINIPKILSGYGCAVVLSQEKNNKVENLIRSPNRAGACGLHIMPYGHNSVYIGATNNLFLSPKFTKNAGLIRFILECAFTQLNQNYYNSNIKKILVGNRPATIDNFPLMGKCSPYKNCWILTGFYRDGFTQSPTVSKEIAQMILNRTSNHLFNPCRKPIITRTKKESIAEFKNHFLSGTYEHGASLPKFMMQEEFTDILEGKITEIYDKLEIDFGLSPEILLMLWFDKSEKTLKNLARYFANIENK